jgi:hypothetical protein
MMTVSDPHGWISRAADWTRPTGPSRSLRLIRGSSEGSFGLFQDNLRIRGWNGYVMPPPSIRTANPYRWAEDSASLFADAPEWLIDLVTSAVVSPRRSILSRRQRGMTSRACSAFTEAP